MTPTKKAELARLERLIPPGDWKYDEGENILIAGEAGGGLRVIDCQPRSIHTGVKVRNSVGAFIAAARNAIPSLLQENADQAKAVEVANDERRAFMLEAHALKILIEKDRAKIEALTADRDNYATSLGAANRLAINMRKRAELAEAKITALEARQRTPGTVEGCSMCMHLADDWARCQAVACPLRAPAQPKADAQKEKA